MTIRKRLQSILWRVPVEQEVRDEIALHVELRTRELVASGMDPAAARTEAERRFGDSRRVHAELTRLGHDRNRSFGRREWLSELRQDLSFAWRQCRQNPAFALAAVLTLAIGIGATTAIFSVVHAVVLRPFPYPDADRVLLVYTTSRGRPTNVSVGNYEYLRRRGTTLEHLAARGGASFNLTEGSEPSRHPGAIVTWSYFQVFGIPPLHGRPFTAAEDRPGAEQVAVIAERLWRRQFGGDPSVVGRTVRMNGVPYTIVGVMPARFDEVGWGEEVWVPAAFTAERLTMYDEHFLTLVARQRPNYSLAQVNDELARTAEELRRDHPEHNRDRGAEAQVLGNFVVGNYRVRLFILLAAVGLVLVIACANVANLLLARLAARSRELAIRAAIGAGRGRIVRQVLTESLFISTLGGVLGLLLAWWSIPALVSLAPAAVPRLESAALNAEVVAAALALVVFCALVVGLIPAWHATRGADTREALGEGKGTMSGAIRPWLRQALIAGQAALVLMVLSGAALLVRSAINLQQVDLGFDTSGVLAARVALPTSGYGSPAQAQVAFAQMLDRVADAPGVALAALDSQPPLLANGSTNGLMPEGRAPTEDRILSQSHFITPDYFAVLRIPVVAGRTFTGDDRRQSPLVMIVNQTLARTAFGTEDAIGKRMMCCEGGPDDPRYKTIVGVVADVHGFGPAQPPRPEFYLPLPQIPDPAWWWIGRTLHVLTRGESPAALAVAIRSGVRHVDPSLPVFAVRTMDEGRAQSLAQARFNTLLMTLLGLTGLVLAALGIYSVIAWLASQRRREIGVRMALGASAGNVVSMMTWHGLKPVTVGLAAGLAATLVTTRVLQGELFNVEPRDPLLLGATVLVLLLVAGLAALLPAWRAARIDPSRALHE
jgi:putative ABC transport system permease protein